MEGKTTHNFTNKVAIFESVYNSDKESVAIVHGPFLSAVRFALFSLTRSLTLAAFQLPKV